jgi:preprotein translocase subunit SecE
VARNRKRARERRPRQPGTPADPRQGLPTATHDTDNGAAEHEHDNGAAQLGRGEEAAGLEPVELESSSVEDDLEAGSYQQDEDVESEIDDDGEDGAPPPLQHAMPDGELAEEQLEVGRPDEPEPEEGEDEEEFEREVEESISGGRGGRGRGGRRRGYSGGRGAGGSGGGELAAPGTTAVAERRPGLISRFIGFLQGSWRELQRVQWPDRRQVFQATGVVIGFVIVAAVFLGVADWVSGKLVTFVLK